MHKSTLDLFSEYHDRHEADKFARRVEMLAAKYEVTCDYIIDEFLIDKKPNLS